MKITKEVLIAEAKRIAGSIGGDKKGVEQVLLASFLASNGMPVDVVCPECSKVLAVKPFPGGFSQGCTITCECGLCSDTHRGL